MDTTQDTTPVQGPASSPVTPTTGWSFSSITDAIGITGSKDTMETLEAERKKCNDDIDARLKKLQAAPAPAPAPVEQAEGMGGGRRRTRRSRRSKKSKRRRGNKRSGRRTRR